MQKLLNELEGHILFATGRNFKLVRAQIHELLVLKGRAAIDAGANGVVIAEPLAGLLSPALVQEFSGDYCKRIAHAVQSEDFVVIYHNCSNTAIQTLGLILSCGAKAYHFGNAIPMAEMKGKFPSDILAIGNIDVFFAAVDEYYTQHPEK